MSSGHMFHPNLVLARYLGNLRGPPMSSALLASPDKLATFLATNWMASEWKMVRPSSLLATMVCSWVWVYGWNTCQVRCE